MAKAKKKAVLTAEERLEQALVPEEEQPYPVPENWCWTRLGSVAQWGSGGTPSRKNIEYYNGTIPWVKTGELCDAYIYATEEQISDYAVANSNAKLYPVNSVLIAMYGATIGKVGILGIKATTNQACACAICTNAVTYKYLFYYLRSQKDAFIKKGKGGAQPNISQEIIKIHEIPIPPVKEQQRIVDRIESLFAKLDEAREKAQAALESFETRKAAILHKAFTGELTAKWREQNGVGMDSWKYKQLGKCGRWVGGGTPSKSQLNYWENGSIPWISPKDMKSNIIEDTIDHITSDAIKESSTNLISSPAIIFVMRSGILRRILPIAMTKIPVTLNQDMKAMIPEEINQEYMFWVCTANERMIRESCAKSGTTVESINAAALFNFIIPIASKSEQIEIVRLLDDFFAKEQKAKELCSVLDKIDLIKKSILARAFRGELGTNDPTEESALELLKSIV